jgi:hypothetical protein
MPIATIKCPRCGGIAYWGGVLPCDICLGAGRITHQHQGRIIAGRYLRQRRLAQHLNKQQMAVLLGIRISDLNDLEAGRETDCLASPNSSLNPAESASKKSREK